MAINYKLLQQIFQPVNKKNPQNNALKTEFPFKRGNLILFNYMFWKHDPYPLVIISPPPNQSLIVQGKGHLWGVNLHMLQFKDMQRLLKNAKSPNFSYLSYVKGDTQLRKAYRSYKWAGIRQVKTLNVDFFLNVAGTIRSQDPAEVEIIRKNVQEQIDKQINPKAYEINTKTLNKQVEPLPGIVPSIKTVPIVQNKVE